MRFWGIVLVLSVFLCPQAFAQDEQAPAPAPPAQRQVDARPAETIRDLNPGPDGQLSQGQMRELIRVVAQNYRDNYKKERDYTYIDHEVSNKLDGRGQVKVTETRTYEHVELYGEPVQRLIEKDDKPLDEKDAAKEEERIQKLIDKRKNESEEEQRKRQAEKEKARQKGREFVSEVPDAYNFRLIGSEILNGRDTWVIDGEPLPEFQAHMKEAEVLSKLRGRLWIDKGEMQLAKMDIELLDTASFGWIVARIHKGTRLVYEWTRVNDEVWLPQHYEAKLDARIALFKNDNEQDAGTYRDYMKFRSSSKIVGMGEVHDDVPQQK
jgi:hypothetical protein